MHRTLRRAVLNGPDYPSRRIARRVTFFILLGLSAVFGSMCGLMFVYSIDLPPDGRTWHAIIRTLRLSCLMCMVRCSALLRWSVGLCCRMRIFRPVLRQAIISIEDKSFESNWGVKLVRAVGAAYRDLHSSGRAQGASTLTMQLARNLFLSSEKTYGRKLQEVFLSVQIERRFTKQQIFELYANQIYLGMGRMGLRRGLSFSSTSMCAI